MTISIRNDTMLVSCREDSGALSIIDVKRGTCWMLDPLSQVYSAKGSDEITLPLKVVGAQRTANDRLVLTCLAGDCQVIYTCTLNDSYIEIALSIPENTAPHPAALALPGSFTVEGEKLRYLLPIMQGMLWDGQGDPFSARRAEGSHLGFSMAFTGVIAERGGLLFTAETRDDCLWWFGKDTSGRTWAANLQTSSLGSLRYERVARIYLTNPDIVAVAKTYRRKVIEQGRFTTWEEKIAERPALERLFGAVMCFVGYCKDDLDYLAGCRKLKDYGFDRALLYPGRFNMYYPDIRMGGVPAINLPSPTVEAIKALGYDVAPWSWLNEALDTGQPEVQRMFRRGSAGELLPFWAIDQQQWYGACYGFLPDYQTRALKTTIADMTWDHFDVLACVPPGECYALDHPQHPGQPASRSEGRQWVRQTFLADQGVGRVVSSENFNDAYSLEMDIGSVKAWPQYGPWPFWPIPLTMLVYHDSMIHSWWEVHSYNNPWSGRTFWPGRLFEYGGGRPHLMAALDALMGCPPDVFPFGAQYGYSGWGRETFLYRFRFEDPEVQIALRAALPVARLHRRIGKQEMVHFKILSEDGYIQESAFTDGTHIVANFSRDVAGPAPGGFYRGEPHVSSSLMPESWQVVE